jgi:hypothetical protein
VKDYIGLKCPRCGAQLDFIVEPRTITMGDNRVQALSRTPAVYVVWAESVIPHDCQEPNKTGQSYINPD